ncbi:MAG: hypothetical protein ACOC1L_00705 [Bacillota bacterium]
MNIKNNIIKEKLKNVYFIAGTNCGGKTTMAKALSEKYDMEYYSADEHYWEHRKISDAVHQPNMNRPFYGWEEYFARDKVNQGEWLLRAEDEELDFIILDLIILASKTNKMIVVDIHRAVDLFTNISDFNRVIFLLADVKTVRKQYFGRDDKNALLECIQRETNDPEKAIQNTLDVACYIAEREIELAKASPFLWHIRDDKTSFDSRLAMVEKHFKLS